MVPNAKLGALGKLNSAHTIVRLLMAIGALLAGVGIFMRWYAFGGPLDILADGFSGVDLGIAGTALLLLVILTLVFVAVDETLMAASTGIALLGVSALILMNWRYIFHETWGRVVRIECMPPCNVPGAGAGVFATVGGTVIVIAACIVDWRKKSKDSESAASPK